MKKILLFYIIFGIQFIYSQQPSIVYLQEVYFADSLHGCAVGDSGVVIFTTDGGINWFNSEINNKEQKFSSIFLIDSLQGFSIGLTSRVQNYESFDSSGIFRTDNGGKNWNKIAKTNHHFRSMFFVDSSSGFIAGDYASISKTTDNGNSWNTKFFINGSRLSLFSIGFINKDVGWAAGSSNASFRGVFLWTENGGESWEIVDSSIYNYITDAQFVSTSTGFLASIDGIFKTTDKGKTWVQKASSSFSSIIFINEQSGWAVGNYGKIFKTIDGGETWIDQSITTNESLNSIFFLNERYGWIVGGWHSTILSTTDGGDNWNSQLITTVGENSLISESFTLFQNYPNPFNPSTTIKYNIPQSSYVTIKIYDILGREVRTLINEEKSTGNYEIKFDGSDLASGIYFYRLTAGDFSETKKLMLQK